MRTGDEITIEPSELVAGGDALARVDGFPIFAGNVYPGDVALVRLTEVKKGFARAELVRIERASPSRRGVRRLRLDGAAARRAARRQEADPGRVAAAHREVRFMAADRATRL